MSLEKPWEKPFELLLSEMEAAWGGTVKRSKESDFWVYPTYKTEIEAHPTYIEVSEFPVAGISVGEAADNVEYLRIYVQTKTDHELFIRQENFLDDVKKKFGLLVEHQTGSEVFDDKYVLFVRGDVDKDLLKQPDTQESIQELAPSAMRIFEHGIQWSQQLQREEQLEFGTIAKCAERLVDLAKTVRKLQ